MSFFHINIKSLPKHYDELEIYLNSLNFNFSFIALSQTWLDEYKQGLYELPNYTSINEFRKNKKGVGVSLYIADYLKFKRRHDLEYFDSEMESLFIEIEGGMFNLECNLIIGVLYRMPNACVDVFNEMICDVLNIVQKERKICYFIGDLNIDLLKCENHKPTATFLENWYTYSVFPLITKPTRITNESATLIDHVLTNNFDVNSKHMQGILCTSISDHYAIFHIAGNAENASFGVEISPILQRNYSQRNINNFLNEVNEIEWSGITEMDDAQQAYSAFHKLLAEKYVSWFPFRKIAKRYHHNKPWLTAGLKESIKIKNKLYVKRLKGGNTEDKCEQYRIYRN